MAISPQMSNGYTKVELFEWVKPNILHTYEGRFPFNIDPIKQFIVRGATQEVIFKRGAMVDYDAASDYRALHAWISDNKRTDTYRVYNGQVQGSKHTWYLVIFR
jgi:hypothetical protein